MQFLRWSFVASALFAAGCGTKHSVTPADPGRLAEKEARAVLDAAIRRGAFDPQMPIEFRRREIFLVATTLNGKKLEVRIPLDGQITEFRCAPGDGCDAWVRATGAPQGAWLLNTRNDPAQMQKVVDAFNELVARNIYADRLDKDFPAKAAAWRAADPKPPLSENGNKRRILAENAFREKNVALAIEHFEAALETDPTWPDGNFNLALLYGETNEFRLAAFYMKRYLTLVPDSKDAKAAREKLIIWEDKAGRAHP